MNFVSVRTRLSGLVPVVLSLAAGCACPERTNPPANMIAGLLGYATTDDLVPKLQRQGVAKLKCVMAPVKLEASYSVPSGLNQVCQDQFEFAISEANYEIAAKEAVDVIVRKAGLRGLDDLFDPEAAKRFRDAVQQDGRSVVDFVFLARITGVSPALQIQGKVVSANAGPDWGQQITVLEEIDWKKLWAAYCEESTGKVWKMHIQVEKVSGGGNV